MSKPRNLKVSKLLDGYFGYILLHLLLPLLPIGLEYLSTGKVAPTSLTLMASFYAVSIGFSSYSLTQFAIGIIVCVIFAFMFGMISQGNTPTLLSVFQIKVLAGGTIVAIFIIHAIERYSRHVIDCEPFWSWSDNSEK
jgi:membrane-anchored protein YejM (alkaline phosphatase superfamily)